MWIAAFVPIAVWLAQAQPPETALLQYGAIGVVAMVALVAVRVLWAATNRSNSEAIERERANADRAIERERANTERERERGDRLEEELRKQHQQIQEKVVVALHAATGAVQDAMTVMRERR